MTLLLLSVALYGSSEIQIDDYTQRVDITKNSEVFIDAQDHFDFKEVSGEIFNNNFEPAGTTAVFAKSIKDSVWIRFKLVNETDSLFLGKIELPLYWLHKIGIYLKDGSSAMLGEKEMKGRSFFYTCRDRTAPERICLHEGQIRERFRVRSRPLLPKRVA